MKFIGGSRPFATDPFWSCTRVSQSPGWICVGNESTKFPGGGRMSALDESIAKKLSRLIRMFGSSFENERHNALAMMQRVLESAKLSFNDIAVLIENHSGEIEAKKYSDADAEIIYAKGIERGRAEEARKSALPPEFFDADGRPQWNAMALFCQKHVSQLRSDWEREFVSDMAGKTIWREPTEKQAKHLLAIFVKLGGRYDPKTAHVRR
jgi:hypothetical protein